MSEATQTLTQAAEPGQQASLVEKASLVEASLVEAPLVEEELLVEEVSIDGMCGVY